VPGQLESPESQKRNQTADVQAIRRRVEASIKCSGLLLEVRLELLLVGSLYDQTPTTKLGQQR